MRIECLHGYFKFTETWAGQVFDFARLFALPITQVDNYFTFEFLQDAPNYAIKLNKYLGALVIKTFEGKPWEVMRANDLIYDFESDAVKSIFTVTRVIKVVQAENYFVSDGLILPGSIKEDGSRVTDYSAWFSKETMKFRYSAVGYE